MATQLIDIFNSPEFNTIYQRWHSDEVNCIEDYAQILENFFEQFTARIFSDLLYVKAVELGHTDDATVGYNEKYVEIFEQVGIDYIKTERGFMYGGRKFYFFISLLGASS